jgi:peptidoglycan-associated lipoprotein
MIRTAMIALLLTTVACKKKPPETPMVTKATVTTVPEAPQTEVPSVVKDMMANFERVFFELDAHTLSDEAKAALQANVEIMQGKTDIKVEVQGHADERGTTDYNLALGQKRAESVRSYMMGMGIGADRIQSISFGEERPMVEGSGEGAWSKNRRAEFTITWGAN